MPYIDCLIGNEEDFEKVLGYHAEGVDVAKAGALDVGPFKKMVERVVKDFPNIKVVGTTLRGVKTATINDWSAIMWADGKFYDGPNFENLEIEDRVGGGDGFASGFTYGFLTGKTPQECVNLGVAHGAMLMSTMGDTSQITLEELTHVAGGGSARIKRNGALKTFGKCLMAVGLKSRKRPAMRKRLIYPSLVGDGLSRSLTTSFPPAYCSILFAATVRAAPIS